MMMKYNTNYSSDNNSNNINNHSNNNKFSDNHLMTANNITSKKPNINIVIIRQAISTYHNDQHRYNIHKLQG